MFPSIRSSLAGIAVAAAIANACGGSQAPAESPEVTPDSTFPSEAGDSAPPSVSQASDAEDAGADTHTMPDGTTMPGAEHGEGKGEHQH